VYVAPMSLAGIRNPQQQETHAPQQSLIRSLVSACERSVRNKKAERLGGLEVEGEERTREN
jgi:hypothetical protein